MRKICCAIYTRKSTEEGLEQDFNSLDAQREACSAYIASQKHEGWVLLPKHYDDGGLSGGTLDRPAIRQLMQDVDDSSVDQIVVYKIDRLTRSLADFAKLVDRLDAAKASFVSVTQSFNTSTSMGRLTLNVLLSFAQFEREVTAERIRDKIAASKRKGMWMGGSIPLGYDASGRTLTIKEAEAGTVGMVFDLYEQLGTIHAVAAQAEQMGLLSKVRISRTGTTTGGHILERGRIHHILTNPVYAGKIRHKNLVYEGRHPPIIEPKRWQLVHEQLKDQASRSRNKQNKAVESSSLTGKLRDETGDRLTPSHANKQGRRYRYYVSHRLIKRSGEKQTDGWRLPAKALEDQIAKAVLDHLKQNVSGGLLIGPDFNQITKLQTAVAAIAQHNQKQLTLLSFVKEARLEPGKISIDLDRQKTSEALKLDPSLIEAKQLKFTRTFQSRKRGVESKLVVGQSNISIDPILIRNIARAHHWYEAIKSGLSFEQIAKRDQTSKHRVMQTIHLAFLSPEILKTILQGHQPTGLTTKWLLRNPLPSCWRQQTRKLATL